MVFKHALIRFVVVKHNVKNAQKITSV